MFRLKSYHFLILSLILGCGDGKPPAKGTNGVQDETQTAVPVQTQVIQSGTLVDLVKATGTIFPFHDVVVSSETQGTITEVFVNVGDWVKKDEPLIQVDEELKQLAVEQAEANLLQAKAAFEKAQKDLERNEKLFETKDISEYVFENARLQKQSAEAAFLTAQANLKVAKRQLRDASIVSPIPGFVAARLVELGGTVAPGTPVAKVVDISQVKVKFGVPEKDVVKMKRGQAASISVDAFANTTFKGVVTAVGPQADLSTRSFPIEIVVDNPNARLKAGMVARVEVATKEIEDVPLLPKSALLERSGRTIVFVVENGRADERQPELGLERGEQIALLSGAKAGERVVVLGQENLSDGARVTVESAGSK